MLEKFRRVVLISQWASDWMMLPALCRLCSASQSMILMDSYMASIKMASQYTNVLPVREWLSKMNGKCVILRYSWCESYLLRMNCWRTSMLPMHHFCPRQTAVSSMLVGSILACKKLVSYETAWLVIGGHSDISLWTNMLAGGGQTYKKIVSAQVTITYVVKTNFTPGCGTHQPRTQTMCSAHRCLLQQLSL